MPLAQALVGIQSVSDGATITQRGGRSGDIITSQLHGLYYEASSRRNIFSCASQAATAWSAALNTTYTGVVLSNPAGSGANLSLLQVGFAAQIAPASIATWGIISGFITTGLTVHTTPLAPLSTFLGTPKAAALADAAATLVGTPVWTKHLGTVFTTLSSQPGSIIDLGGVIVIPPGGWAAIGTLVALTALGSLVWEEIPI